MNPLIQLKTITLSFLIMSALGCLGLSRTAQAVSPTPDGVYPNGNTAEGGASALHNLTIGRQNTALGVQTLFYDTVGDQNTAVGYSALFSNTRGVGNTAVGVSALQQTDFIFPYGGGHFNTAVGFNAASQNSIGMENTAIGANALSNAGSSSFNIGLGTDAGLGIIFAEHVIAIGTNGADVDNSCFIGQIWGRSGGSQAVYVNADGKLGALVSSRRFKDEIKPIEHASEVIYGLKPVSFRYKPEIEPTRPLGFGLVAEDVEKVSPDLVVRDKEGKPYSVRYDQVNAMLLNEFLKEHRAFIEEQRKVEKLETTVAQQQKQIEGLTAGLQKVSAQLKLSKPALQVVNNP